MCCRNFLRTLGPIALVLFPVINLPLLGQVNTATLLGRVLDSSGAVIPGANVAAKHLPTGFVRSTDAAPDGSYRIPSLPVGAYEVTKGRVRSRDPATTAVAQNSELRTRNCLFPSCPLCPLW